VDKIANLDLFLGDPTIKTALKLKVKGSDIANKQEVAAKSNPLSLATSFVKDQGGVLFGKLKSSISYFGKKEPETPTFV